MTNLMIVESPTKASKIRDILGSGWIVEASMGHIADLAAREIGIDLNTYKIDWQLSEKGRGVISKLKSRLGSVTEVYLATDPDREGEAISGHLREYLRLSSYKRITFSEITESGIRGALASPRQIDQQLVDAQEARRAADRLIGYRVSYPISNAAGMGLSAGRCQSPAVRLVVERQDEIDNFKETDHFTAMVEFDDGAWSAEWQTKPFLTGDSEYILDRTIAERAASCRDFAVAASAQKPAMRAPGAPFTTSALLQAAGATLKLPPAATQAIAQKLFESGHITYHRTDNPNLSEDGAALITEFAQSKGWPLAAKKRRWKIPEGAQEAHEAIRPTHPEVMDAGDAAAFAHEVIHWFAADGSALPYGRSLIYRFAQSGFWGALAYADAAADLPWGVIKGLALRNIRWWMTRPIFAADGTLTLGYGYPNLTMLESYNSPGSPYWALKAGIALAVPDDHPFWTAQEQPMPELEPVRAMPQARMVVSRDPGSTHVVALANGQPAPFRHGAEKYAKFAYSTSFAFSVPAGSRGLSEAAADSMLAVSDDAIHYRFREESIDSSIDGAVLRSRWKPYDDVEIETWLVAAPPWHVRVHRVRTGRALTTAEGGFATSRPGGPSPQPNVVAEPGRVSVIADAGGSGLADLSGERDGQAVIAEPNTNLLLPRTTIPTLHADLEAGEHWLSCAVLADPDPDVYARAWDAGPPDPATVTGLPNPPFAARPWT